MTELALFLAAFATVFLLVFQQQNVIHRSRVLGSITSLAIGTAQLTLWRYVPEASYTQLAAVLIGGPNHHEGIDRLLRRLRGVLVARKFVIMDYDLEEAKLEAATAIAGGIESPTVSPLKEDGWVAVRVMVTADEANEVMDRLADLGARAILVTAIHAARL